MVKPTAELLKDCDVTVAAPRTSHGLATYVNDLLLDLVECNKDKKGIRDFYDRIDKDK